MSISNKCQRGPSEKSRNTLKIYYVSTILKNIASNSPWPDKQGLCHLTCYIILAVSLFIYAIYSPADLHC